MSEHTYWLDFDEIADIEFELQTNRSFFKKHKDGKIEEVKLKYKYCVTSFYEEAFVTIEEGVFDYLPFDEYKYSWALNKEDLLTEGNEDGIR